MVDCIWSYVEYFASEQNEWDFDHSNGFHSYISKVEYTFVYLYITTFVYLYLSICIFVC